LERRRGEGEKIRTPKMDPKIYPHGKSRIDKIYRRYRGYCLLKRTVGFLLGSESKIPCKLLKKHEIFSKLGLPPP